MTIVNPLGKPIKAYVDKQVTAESNARTTADSNLQSNINTLSEEVATKVPTSRKVNGHALTADVTVTKGDVGLGNTDNGAKAPSTDATLASTTNPPTAKVVKDYVDGKFSGDLGTAAYKDVGTAAGNVPVLDANGKLVASTIPELAISRYLGASDTKANLTKITGGQIGDWATVTADPTEANNGAYMLTATTGLTGTWTQITGPTSLVWGKIGGTLSSQTDLQNALDGKQAKLTAGTGLSLSGATLAIKNAVTAGTVGSATAIPVITYNAQGQITAVSTKTVYPPTTAGTSGQFWKSDGSGVGVWESPATKTNATTAGEGLLATVGAVRTITSSAVSSTNHVKVMTVKGESAFVKGDNAITFKAPGASATGDKAVAYGDDLQAHVIDDATVIICSPASTAEDAWISTGISLTDLTYASATATYTATFNASVANTSALAFTLQCTTYV